MGKRFDFFCWGRKNLRFWSLEKKGEIFCRSINSRVNRSRENYFSLEDLKNFFFFFFVARLEIFFPFHFSSLIFAANDFCLGFLIY